MTVPEVQGADATTPKSILKKTVAFVAPQIVEFTQPAASQVMANQQRHTTNMQPATPAEEKQDVAPAAGQHGMQGHGTLPVQGVAAHLCAPPEAVQALASLAMEIAPGALEQQALPAASASTSMQSVASLTAALQEIIGKLQSQQAVHPAPHSPFAAQSEANMPPPPAPPTPTPAALMPAPTPGIPGVPKQETAVAVPGTPQPEITEPGASLAIVPFQKKLANSSTHPKEYGQFRRFCERNEGSSMQVVTAFESESQLSDVSMYYLYKYVVYVALTAALL